MSQKRAFSAEKVRIGNCFAKALASYDQHALAQQQINQRLCQMLQTTGQSRFGAVLELGCGTGGLTRLLAQQCEVRSWWLNDLNAAALAQLKPHLPPENVQLLAADAESLDRTLPLAQQFDLLASASTVQWFQQPQRLVALAQQALKPDGVLLFSTFLPDNLREIKQLTKVGLCYPSQTDWLDWLQPHFELLAIDADPIELLFDNPSAVLRHLQATGVTATNRTQWTKGRLQAFYQAYQQHFSTMNGQVRLNYAPLLILARKKS
ncbi:malonyl-ACP O-methyltransferase BioC [Testudinibacter sp. P27/CKL/0425]